MTGVEGRVPPPTEADWNRIVGSYHLRICQRDTPCRADADREVLGTYFVSIQRHAITLRRVAPDQNACYVSARVRLVHDSYAGQMPSGIFAVQPRSDTPVIVLVLTANVDAFYDAYVVIRDGRLQGYAKSDGGFPQGASAKWPKDTVVGERIGPPDPRPCFRPAEATDTLPPA
jgi:hypothetical protein